MITEKNWNLNVWNFNILWSCIWLLVLQTLGQFQQIRMILRGWHGGSTMPPPPTHYPAIADLLSAESSCDQWGWLSFSHSTCSKPPKCFCTLLKINFHVVLLSEVTLYFYYWYFVTNWNQIHVSHWTLIPKSVMVLLVPINHEQWSSTSIPTKQLSLLPSHR
jgi:hypothetical protein